MPLPLFPAVARPRRARPRGRPPAAADPAARELRAAVLKARVLYAADVDALAAHHRVSRRTILRWSAEALDYPECRHLRRGGWA